MTQIDPTPKRSTLTQPAFLAVCGILLLAAITLNGATQSLKLHFKKDPVPQPREFRDLPAIMGQWLQISEDEKLDRETQSELGTDKYLYRDYIRVDKRGADLLIAAAKADASSSKAATQPSEDDFLKIRSDFNAREKTFDDRVKMIQDALKGKTPAERQGLVAALQSQKTPGSEPKEIGGIVDVGLTYYTGLVDTVAHIPDRCYIASGYEATNHQSPQWSMGKDAAGKDQLLEVRFMNFEDQTGSNRVSKCVAYVFNANGSYMSNPDDVRLTLQDLTKRYGYYAKIELMIYGRDLQVAYDSMGDFLANAKPQIETCFPDWNKLVQARR